MKRLKKILILLLAVVVVAYASGLLYLRHCKWCPQTAAEYATEHAENKSVGLCALYVRKAINAGGIPLYRGGNAWHYKYLLQLLNFEEKRDSEELKVGEEVAAIGNPLGELTFTMTNGILSALDREINTDGNPQNMIQTNAAINSGNSGGPLFDMDGNVIGVTSAKYSGTTSSGTVIEGLGFAIPINDALWVAYDLVDYGYVRGQAYLGVEVQTLSDSTAAYYGLPVGPRVATVVPGSCAEKAGIVPGDIIVAMNDHKIESHTALAAALKKVKAGDTVELTLFRAGAEMKVTAVLDEKPRFIDN